MRVSTQGTQNQWLDDIYARQSEIVRLQTQVATGRSFSTAGEDPARASQAVTLQQGLDRIANYSANAEAAQRRLNLEENALSTFGDSLTRLRELAVQAGDGNLSPESRAAIASEASQLLQGLLDTANAQDGEGRFLFGGTRTTATPFVQGSAGIQYNGDQGIRVQRIGDSRTVQENDSGSDVFLAIGNGNGTFSVGANAGNQGSASVANSSVVSPGAWVPGNYSITFSGSAAYTVLDAGGATVASGTYASGQAISFNGVSVTLSGSPVAGDSFSVNRSVNQDVFTTVQNFVNALRAPSGGSVDQARYLSQLNATIADLDQAENHISLVHSRLGGRLNALDDQASTNQALSDQLQATLSTIRDVDYAKVLTELQQQQSGLDAAYQVYAKAHSSSLFGVL